MGVDGIFGLSAGYSLENGFAIGASVHNAGYDLSARPGLGAAAVVAVATATILTGGAIWAF